MAGPRGGGKTLLATVVLQDCATPPVCYVPCRQYDTQYQVLARLTTHLTGEPVTEGYRTVQLHRRVAMALEDTPTVLVLDDVEFLLQNDGNDLLYTLSRLIPPNRLTVLTIATPSVDLMTALDARTASSFQPRHLDVAPYTVEEAVQILKTQTDTVPQLITTTALERIAQLTTNITVGLTWLTRVDELHDPNTVITADSIPLLRRDVLHRYWRSSLTDFTRHHAIVLTAVEQLTVETETAYTGMVYDRYATLCRCRGWHPLTRRRISDYLDQLELLGLIQIKQYQGGAEGKTRAITLTPLQEL